ncbi:aspartate aminotransferase family protein [Amylibacter sp.]|nr:aspartate aminotransferase family protein [Amylibacter sp.]MDC1489395.1 aspartate aminotransferase family protein [Amylibacter sp.]MDC3303304.1 aspartate aminotransferase family protein [Amylibacter sp.]
MSNVFPRQITNPPIRAVSSEGCYIIDENGTQYFDGSGGAAVSCLGHDDPDVIKAIQDQTSKMAFAHTGFFSSDPAEELAELLIKHAPGELDRVYFVSGGSEAIEAALKLARQFHVENGEPSRHHIIARKQSYHGNTLGALAAGGNKWRRNQFEPILIDASHIAPCYEYVDKTKEETSYDYGQRVAQELEDEILRLGYDKVMAFIVEPVVGATMGAVPAVPGYFKRVRDICDKYGVLLILDEVMCGMGRTGHLFASEFDGISPDILCIAKGLGAGYQPIGAMLCSKNIYDVIGNGSGFFQHGHTYMGHPVACAAGLAVLKAILSRNLLKSINKKSDQLFNSLKTQLAHNPYVGDIRGRGLFIGIEIVKNLETKKPFAPDLKIASSIKYAAFKAGLICYPMSGTRDGKWGDHILLAPPFIMNESQIIELVDKVSIALKVIK